MKKIARKPRQRNEEVEDRGKQRNNKAEGGREAKTKGVGGRERKAKEE